MLYNLSLICLSEDFNIIRIIHKSLELSLTDLDCSVNTQLCLVEPFEGFVS